MQSPATLTDTQLDLEHRRLNQWLDLPGSEKWAEHYRENLAQAEAVWQEMSRRKAARTDRRAA